MSFCKSHNIRYDHFLCPLCVEEIRVYSEDNGRPSNIEPIDPKLLEDAKKQQLKPGGYRH